MLNYDKKSQFKCALCGNVYNKGWSDEEAGKELEKVFPGFDTDERVIVCDDCYKKMGFSSENHPHP